MYYMCSIYVCSICHYCIMENLKKSGENKNKLRTIYPRNHENLRTASIESNVTGSYKKRVYR